MQYNAPYRQLSLNTWSETSFHMISKPKKGHIAHIVCVAGVTVDSEQMLRRETLQQ